METKDKWIDLLIKNSITVGTLNSLILMIDQKVITQVYKHEKFDTLIKKSLKPWEEWSVENEELAARPGSKEMYERSINVALASLANTPNTFNVMAFIYRVALHDAYLSDLVALMLKANPALLKTGGKSLTYEQILEKGSIEKITDDLINREVMDFGYLGPRKPVYSTQVVEG